jgi:hypothetical protein
LFSLQSDQLLLLLLLLPAQMDPEVASALRQHP